MISIYLLLDCLDTCWVDNMGVGSGFEILTFPETFLPFSLHFQNKSLSLQSTWSRTLKWISMALKIKTREEAIAVLRDMVRRKKDMEAKAQIDFAKAREEATDCYACL